MNKQTTREVLQYLFDDNEERIEFLKGEFVFSSIEHQQRRDNLFETRRVLGALMQRY